MSANDRRTFLQQTGAGIAGASVLNWAGAVQALGANEKIVMGAIGLGGPGTNLARSFAAQKDVELAYVCDPDTARAERAAETIKGISGKSPQVMSDLRKVLDDPRIEAVTVATPDHWHGPATLLALAAGKHVYVEKPCAHNIREGRLMVEAARKQKRVVQVGTQSRSSESIIRAMELLREGAIGEVLVAKAWNSQRRGDIGHVQPGPIPAGFDYDLWLGPAPFVPFQSNRHHYGWHWWFDFGTGDTGNDGVHDIDIARWGLGVNTQPSHVAASGGKYFFNDDQQFPDTQYAAFEYPGDGQVGHKKQLIYEMRIWSPYRQEAYENGNAFYGTEGTLLLGKNDGWQLFGPRNKLKETMKPGGMGEPHHRNFLECIRAEKLPNADIEIGHLSASLCHLANISSRIGQSLQFDPKTEQIIGCEPANALVKRSYRDGHWAVPKGV
jgi:predicted dehydrogenase